MRGSGYLDYYKAVRLAKAHAETMFSIVRIIDGGRYLPHYGDPVLLDDYTDRYPIAHYSRPSKGKRWIVSLAGYENVPTL